MRVLFVELARRDIADIYGAIAVHNARAALRVEDMIRSTCEGLKDFPYIAVATDEPLIYRLPLVRYPYTIFYRVDPGRNIVEIARVLHSSRIKDLRHAPKDD